MKYWLNHHLQWGLLCSRGAAPPKQWASYQIRKIAGCACAGNAGNVFPRCQFQRKPLVSDPAVHHARAVMHVGIAYLRWRGKRSRHSGRMRTRNFAYLARGPWRNICSLNRQREVTSQSLTIQFNSLWLSDAISLLRGVVTFVHVLTSCLRAPSHYLSKCWFIICQVHWHPFESNFISYLSHQSLKSSWELRIYRSLFNKCGFFRQLDNTKGYYSN